MRFVSVEGHESSLVMRVVDAELVAAVLNEAISRNGGEEDRYQLSCIFGNRSRNERSHVASSKGRRQRFADFD
jgi:hypothetical protein